MKYRHALIMLVVVLLTACGFHPQGEVLLAPPLHKLCLHSARPYGDLTRYLESYLKTSAVKIVPNSNEAETILSISQDDTSQELTGVSSTQQTRQYALHVNVTFEVTDNKGRVFIPPQSLTETRTITIQSNQILGSSNEANLYYQQMRRELANAIMNRLSSNLATKQINAAFKKTRAKTAS